MKDAIKLVAFIFFNFLILFIAFHSNHPILVCVISGSLIPIVDKIMRETAP